MGLTTLRRPTPPPSRTEVVREQFDDVTDRIEDAVTPAWRQLAGAVGNLLNSLARLLAVLPNLASKVLGTTAGVLHRMGDQSASLANLPTREDQQRSRRKANLLWFLAGTTTGVAAGVVIGRATAPSTPDNVRHLSASRTG